MKSSNANSKVILVSGASSGIGKAIASYLSDKGHRVIGTSRSPQTQAASFEWEILDVTSQKSVESCIQRVVSKYSRIDILINNAGLGMISSLEEAPMDNINRVLDTNLLGVIRVIQTVLPIMRMQNKGHIINISSIAGLMGLPYRSIYSASKFAVEGLTESLRTEVRKFGIEVCTLQPGSIETDIKESRATYIPRDSVYNPELTEVENIIDAEVAKGIAAILVAKKIEKLIGKKHLHSKYVVAKPFQKLVSAIRPVIPRSMFEKLLMTHYQIKD